jgi:MFS family permease
VFPKVFFPHLGTTMAAFASMATFAAAFLSRPLGAAFFGHFGDRLGRKSTLVATLLIMGLSTLRPSDNVAHRRALCDMPPSGSARCARRTASSRS